MGDPLDDFRRYDAEQEEALKNLPVCCECEEHIQDEYLYDFDGDYICEECLKTYHRRAVDDFVS